MAKGRRRSRRLEMKWRRLIAAQGRSGKSVRAFCRGRGVGEASFYYWRRELLRRDGAYGEPDQGQRQGPSAPTGPVTGPAFVPVTLAQEMRPSAGRIEIELSDGRRVHVTAPVDRHALADVLLAVSDAERAVLEARPC